MSTFPKGKYNIIYADPPWNYRDKRKKHKRLCGGAAAYYETMKLADIKALPVKDLAEHDCFLFLWATFPNLPEALEVIQSWGFKYKTVGFNWVKLNRRNKQPFFGIGAYTRSNAEVCLLAVKGKPKVVSNKVSSVILADREKHSKKPDEVRDRIVHLCGNVPRIELFARQRAEGWDAWGNEVEGDEHIAKTDLPEMRA